ncbi:hypothetical protein WA026_018949 [Henosepilachna vigintioctopunctata]|uniref:Uncharacterized protein n=1 Tax=Henosepilachna vigintioctopunctata TaxID=420089 RepID=A0AAW1UQ49_9CUCU
MWKTIPEIYKWNLLTLSAIAIYRGNLKTLDFWSFTDCMLKVIDFQQSDLMPATASLFGSTYICEHLFSRMKDVKLKLRNRISDTHLENSLPIATSDIKANVDRLVKEKQYQVSQ